MASESRERLSVMPVAFFLYLLVSVLVVYPVAPADHVDGIVVQQFKLAVQFRDVVPRGGSRVEYLVFETAEILKTSLVRCEDGLVISSDSSKTRQSFPDVRLTNFDSPRFSLESMEVERMSNTPSGTVSKSALLLTIRNFSRLIVRNGIQVILVAMAGARMTALRTLWNLSRYFAR